MTSMIEERRAKLARLQENYAQAHQLEQELADFQTQLARAQQKRDAFAAHGNKRIEVPNPHPTQLGLEFELEPFRSKLTGSDALPRDLSRAPDAAG
jgi:hypothetical protein